MTGGHDVKGWLARKKRQRRAFIFPSTFQGLRDNGLKYLIPLRKAGRKLVDIRNTTFIFAFSNMVLLYQWRVTFCLKSQEAFFKAIVERKGRDTDEGRPAGGSEIS